MTTNREASLRRLVVGDIFHAASPCGASLICLVTAVTETTIHARTVTTHIAFEFDRANGTADWGDEDPDHCAIDSTAPLPAEIHAVMLGIDRKYRPDPDDLEWLERDPERYRLSEAEKNALLFVAKYYPANPL